MSVSAPGPFREVPLALHLPASESLKTLFDLLVLTSQTDYLWAIQHHLLTGTALPSCRIVQIQTNSITMRAPLYGIDMGIILPCTFICARLATPCCQSHQLAAVRFALCVVAEPMALLASQGRSSSNSERPHVKVKATV